MLSLVTLKVLGQSPVAAWKATQLTTHFLRNVTQQASKEHAKIMNFPVMVRSSWNKFIGTAINVPLTRYVFKTCFGTLCSTFLTCITRKSQCELAVTENVRI